MPVCRGVRGCVAPRRAGTKGKEFRLPFVIRGGAMGHNVSGVYDVESANTNLTTKNR